VPNCDVSGSATTADQTISSDADTERCAAIPSFAGAIRFSFRNHYIIQLFSKTYARFETRDVQKSSISLESEILSIFNRTSALAF
jgi:hypothetical protein